MLAAVANQRLAVGQLRNMARQAWWMLNREGGNYSRVRNGNVFLEVDRQQRVMVAVLTERGEFITTSLQEAAAAIVQKRGR